MNVVLTVEGSKQYKSCLRVYFDKPHFRSNPPVSALRLAAHSDCLRLFICDHDDGLANLNLLSTGGHLLEPRSHLADEQELFPTVTPSKTTQPSGGRKGVLMPLILILVILLVLASGGGYYMGPGLGYYGGGGLSVLLLIIILFLLFGRGRNRL